MTPMAGGPTTTNLVIAAAAGQGYRLAAELPAGEIVDRLCG